MFKRDADDGRTADNYPTESSPSTDTFADVNTDSDPSAPVVEAIYRDELTEALGGWRTVEDLRDAVSFGAVNSYSFPADRVAPTEEGR